MLLVVAYSHAFETVNFEDIQVGIGLHNCQMVVKTAGHYGCGSKMGLQSGYTIVDLK